MADADRIAAALRYQQELDAYKHLAGGITRGAVERGIPAKASESLGSLGVPGIRYLDAGSRSGGKGTSNFVVFDPKHMNIIGRE